MRVLVIGSLAGELGRAARMAIARGARLDQADDIAAGLARLRGDGRVDVVLCDVAHDIASLVASLAAERMAVGVVACGFNSDEASAIRAIKAGAKEFLPLPPDPDLIAAILQAASRDSDTLITRDPAMRAALRRAETVARSEASVLITGESGTGKEVMARHIHAHSRRAQGPFVALNCAAIPENLLESELFGHEKGAFSGAVNRRIGKFEAAEGGTILLDEISEMEIRLQAKLLRVLQEREIDRVGGGAPVRVDVRVLATTNRDLQAEVARGTFREDLFFRLNVVSLRLPPLRERPGDIAPLAEHFARRYAEVNGLAYRALTPAALARLAGHCWRGNVRELENTMHRAVLLAEGPDIDGAAIELSGSGALPGATATPGGSASSAGTPFAGARSGTAPAAPGGAAMAGEAHGDGITALVGRRMEDVERDLILRTLAHTLGNRTHAATILGISIRALRNKLHAYAASGVAVPPPAGFASGAAAPGSTPPVLTPPVLTPPVLAPPVLAPPVLAPPGLAPPGLAPSVMVPSGLVPSGLARSAFAAEHGSARASDAPLRVA